MTRKTTTVEPAETSAEKKAYTYDELAELVGLSRRTIRNHVDAGKLIPTFPTSEPRFTAKEVERWIKSWPVKPPAKTS
ncbi:helix-turn-helix domain-containing protein [Leifsonia sp. NPDC058194]|uniref:helix-turn-helix domain-containing protein n=1 Tax=Leifsonia sp. NPDC058194 TaxID=3346374 RepID=UPI0036DA355D